MLTQNELNISNKSYTNKDFNTIYSELLDLVLTLTNKWDPTHSNESDPGVVLIKLAALMADKNNYNIDKNILECFPLSASQEGNVRAFYDLLGYSMGWYNSATCYVNITSNEDNNVSLEPFKYIISDSDGKINYTLMGQTEIGDTITLTKGKSQQGLVMEGAIQDFTVGGSNIVKLENLDNNLRLYFSEKNVAENGIFISNLKDGKFNYANVQNWVKVDNLASTESTQKCYKFGVLPNSNTCYIQFSPNINRDIADGLIIKYLVSNGENGRIAANVINTFSGDVLGTNQNKITLKVYNPSASIGGYNPQDLEDAYTDYKRVINTFSTLVTEKDYENFIYELRDTLTNRPIVSNVVVSDRTDDIDKTNYVVRLQSDLTSSKKLEIEEKDGKPVINAYNIAIYALRPPTNLNTAKDYNATFTPVDKGQENDIEALIENVKSIQHDYIDTHPSSGNPIPYIYKNQYTLQGTVYTYNKVTDSEARDIEDNIQKALFNNFNAREVEFGYDVSYDHLVDVITRADSRIRLVALNQPEYYLTQMNSDGATKSGDEQSLSAAVKKGLLTKMISKGNVELFNYDKRFNWDFGQLSSKTYDKISSITTKTVITAKNDTQVTVRDNENVQFFRDNYIVKTSYSTYVTYSYEGNDTSPDSLSEGIIYNLTENDKLKVSYTNEDGQKIGPLTLTGFIRPVNVSIEKSPVANYSNYLSGNQAIEVLELNTYTLKSGTKCFWVTTDFEIENDEIKYTLFGTKVGERILDNNEYFIYLDESQNILNILQSGTKLTRDDASSELVYSTSLNINISNVMEQGAEVTGVEWYELLYDITSYEESIISLGSKSKFTLEETIDGGIDNSLKPLANAFSYVDENGNEVAVDNGLDNKWRVRSRLNINAGENNPQQLQDGQTLSIKYEVEGDSNPASMDISKGFFYTNPMLNISGGESINVQELQTDGTYESTLSIYSFVKDTEYTLKRGSNGWLIIDSGEKFTLLNSGIKFSTETKYDYIIPIVFVNNSGSEFKIGFTSPSTNESGELDPLVYGYNLFYNNKSLENYNSEGKVNNFNPGVFYPYIEGNGENITLKITAGTFAGNIYIGNIYKLPATNNFSTQVAKTLEINEFTSESKNDILTKLNAEGYDWVYSPLPEDLIDTDNVDETQKGNLFNPKVVWDANHICNKFTIAQYNANNSSIKISSTSKQR